VPPVAKLIRRCVIRLYVPTPFPDVSGTTSSTHPQTTPANGFWPIPPVPHEKLSYFQVLTFSSKQRIVIPNLIGNLLFISFTFFTSAVRHFLFDILRFTPLPDSKPIKMTILMV
jgi:hypothetical protein